MKKIYVLLSVILCILLLSGCTETEKTAPPADQISPPKTVTPATVISLDKSYFSVLGSTYEDLSAAYGSARIYGNMEWGLYTSFEAAAISCIFDYSIFERYYQSLDSWYFDSDEFARQEGYSDFHYIGERYAPSDFVVTQVNIYGAGINAFLGCDETVMLSMINEFFGQDSPEINFNEMYEFYTASNYEYGEYVLSFDVTPVGNDHLIDVVTIGKNYAQ